MSRVLVTGAAGFVGGPTVRVLLASGHEVHAVSTHARTELQGVRWHRGDLLDPQWTAELVGTVQPEWLLHLAWYSVPGLFWNAPENIRWAEATLRLLRQFREVGGRRAVLAGTCAEYAWNGDGVLDERASPLHPSTLYGVSKRATHEIAASYAAETAMELAWGRLFFLYGPGEHPERLFPSVARALIAGREAPATAGTQVRDFLHIDDAGAAFAALLESSAQGPVNIASGSGVEVRVLIGLISHAAGHPELVRLGALPQRVGEPQAIVAAVDRLRREVGFEPRVALSAGVKETVSWWRARDAAGFVSDER